MNSSLHNHEGKLLVDPENGRILRADAQVTVTDRFLDSHPFIERDARGYVVGPDAFAEVRSIRNNGDFITYEPLSVVGIAVTLQKKIEEN